MNLSKLFALLFCLLVTRLSAQETLKEVGLGSSLETYISVRPQEKVHVHFNKASYLVGDTAWFKLYVLNTNGGLLSSLSKVVYIDVVGTNGLINRMALPLDAGMAWGQVALIDSLYRAGDYKILAYTQLMRNLSEDFYFKHSIPVTSLTAMATKASVKETVSIKQAQASPEKTKQLSLTIFPEGGALVSGLRSKLGVKAVGDDGRGVSVKGQIENDKKEIVSLFETVHAGHGVFALQPLIGAKYTAVITEGIYQGQRFILPQIQQEGYILSVNRNQGDKLNIRISRSKGMEGDREIRILIQAGGEVQEELSLPMSEPSINFTISTKEMREGVNQITLFSAINKPLAERLVFVRRKTETQLLPDKQDYTNRDRVKLNIVVDGAEKGVLGGYSVSVIKREEIELPEEKQLSIVSNLLLSSDLKGYIEDANYYFTNENEQKQSELDLLMLTQGWRRFSWTDVLSDKVEQPKFKAEEGLQISGTVTTTGGKPIAGAKVNLLASRDMVILDTVADAQGRFVFNNLFLSDTSTVIIRARGAKESSNVKIVLDEVESLPAPIFVRPMAIGTDTASNTIKTSQRIEPVSTKIVQGTSLKTVEIIQKRKIPEIKGSVYPFAASPPDYTVEADKLQEEISLRTHLRGRFSWLQIRGDKIYGLNRGHWGPMAILLNGYPIDDLSGINPKALTGVQIVKGGMIASHMGTELMKSSKFGNVILTMGLVDAKFINAKRPTGFVQQEFNGYTFSREFYAPRYDVQKLEPKSDYRTALFWKPDIITGEEGKAEFDFYTSDEKGKYKVILEGISANGQLTRKISYFEVK